MKQKKNWMTYLAIGISLLMVFSCGKNIIDYIMTINHIYVNQTGQDLTFEIYNKHDDLFKSFSIEDGDTINTHISREDGPVLFHIEDKIGDSVIVFFADGKCLTYLDQLTNNKIFNIEEYDNYDSNLIQPGVPYSLYYTFTEEDYNLAVECE